MSSSPLIKQAKFAETNTDEDAVVAHAAYESYSALVEDDEENLDEDAAWLREQRLQHKSLHWLYRPSVLMVGTVLFLIALASSSAEGTRQIISFKLACNSLSQTSDKKYCDPAETQVLVSSLQQAFSVARGIATIVASGKVGPLSDKYGRKLFFILIMVFVIIGSYARYVLSSAYPTLQFSAMVATEFVSNCMGGGMALLTLANCYVSDIAEPSKRTYYLGINFAFFFIGMSSGPLIGNAVLKFFQSHVPKASGPEAQYGPGLTSADFAPLRFELLLFVLVLVVIIFVLPESRGEKARRMSRSLSSSPSMSSLQRPVLNTSKWSRFTEAANFLKPIRVVFYPKDCVHRSRHKTIVRTRIVVILLVLTDCLSASVGAGLGEVFMLYGLYKFKWSAVDIGHLMTVTFASRAFVLIVLSPIITHNFFQKIMGFVPNKRFFDRVDYGLVMIAFVSEAIGQLMLCASKTSAVFLASLVLTSISCIGMPAINSAIIKFYPESKIGEVYGGMAILKNILSIVSPVIVLALYKIAVAKYDYPQILFLGFAGVYALLALLATCVISIISKVEAAEADEVSENVR